MNFIGFRLSGRAWKTFSLKINEEPSASSPLDPKKAVSGAYVPKGDRHQIRP